MQTSTEETLATTELSNISRRIREKDDKALAIANDAKSAIAEATALAAEVANELNTAERIVGARHLKDWITQEFGGTATKRFTSYRRAHRSQDPRQLALAIGAIPTRQPKQTETLPSAKPPAHIAWVNKLIGWLNSEKSLTETERASLQGLVQALSRHHLTHPPYKESIK